MSQVVWQLWFTSSGSSEESGPGQTADWVPAVGLRGNVDWTLKKAGGDSWAGCAHFIDALEQTKYLYVACLPNARRAFDSDVRLSMMDFSARLLQKYLLIWLVFLSLAAYHWGALVSGSVLAGWDPFISSKPYLPYLIAATMFAIGCMLPREEVRQVIHHWPRVLCGTAIQYSVMPALAWSVGHLWGMEGDQLVGVVIVGCVPGAMASNVLTLNARGNTSYSVGLTTAATLLSPLVVPLVLSLTLVSGKSIPASKVWEASYLLLLMVVLPVIAGHLLVIFMPKLESSARRAGPMVANLVILWIIAVIVGLNRGLLATRDVNVVSALLAINVMGYGAGYLSGWAFRFQEPLRRALTLEVGMQNAGLGATLATQLFPDRNGTAIAPALYTFGCMLTGSVLAQYWSGRARRVVVPVDESVADSIDEN